MAIELPSRGSGDAASSAIPSSLSDWCWFFFVFFLFFFVDALDVDSADDASGALEAAAAVCSRCNNCLLTRLGVGEALTVGSGAREGLPGVAEIAASLSERLPDLTRGQH